MYKILHNYVSRTIEKSTELSTRFWKFALVGAIGLGISTGMFYLLTGLLGIAYPAGHFIANTLSTISNFTLNDLWTWPDRGRDGIRPFLYRGSKYLGSRLTQGIWVGLAITAFFVEIFDVHYLIANILGMGFGLVKGFATSHLLVWPTEDGRVYRTESWGKRQVNRITEQTQSTSRSVLQAAQKEAADPITPYVIGLSVVLFVGFSTYTTTLFLGFWSTGGDLGNYVHILSTTVQGEGFLEMGTYYVGKESYFASHFSPMLLLFAPLFALFPSPITLLVAKSLLLASSVLILWMIARRKINSDRVALLLTLSFAINPFLWQAWLFSFQEQALLPLLVFATFLAYHQDKYRWFLPLFALSILVNEFVAIFMGAFLLGTALDEYRYDQSTENLQLLVGLAVVCVAYFVFSQFLMQEVFGGISTRGRTVLNQGTGEKATMFDMVAFLITNPSGVLESLTANFAFKILFLIAFVAPVLFLPLTEFSVIGFLGPYLAFAWIVSTAPSSVTFGVHKPLYLLPFLYIGAIRAYGRINWSKDGKRFLTRSFAILIAIALLTSAGVATQSSVNVVDMGHDNQHVISPKYGEHADTLEAAIDSIPKDASLVTQNNIYPHVAKRPDATYVFDVDRFNSWEEIHGEVNPEYILYDTQLDTRMKDWAVPVQNAYSDRLYEEYGLWKVEDGIFIFKRGYHGQPTGVTKETPELSLRYGIEDFAIKESYREGGHIVSEGGSGTIWFGPYTKLPAGEYTLEARVYIGGKKIDADPLELDVVGGSRQPTSDEFSVFAHKQIEGDQTGWQTIKLNFTLNESTDEMQFRGHRPNQTDKRIELDYIIVKYRNQERDRA